MLTSGGFDEFSKYTNVLMYVAIPKGIHLMSWLSSLYNHLLCVGVSSAIVSEYEVPGSSDVLERR